MRKTDRFEKDRLEDVELDAITGGKPSAAPATKTRAVSESLSLSYGEIQWEYSRQ